MVRGAFKDTQFKIYLVLLYNASTMYLVDNEDDMYR